VPKGFPMYDELSTPALEEKAKQLVTEIETVFDRAKEGAARSDSCRGERD